MTKFKDENDYRKAVSAEIKKQYGTESKYCEWSGIPYSTLHRYLKDGSQSITKQSRRLIEVDLGLVFITPDKAMFDLDNGGVGLNLNTNSKQNHLIADFDWHQLYKIARANKDGGVGKCLVKINTAIEQTEFNCAATLYLNVNKEDI